MCHVQLLLALLWLWALMCSTLGLPLQSFHHCRAFVPTIPAFRANVHHLTAFFGLFSHTLK